MFKMLKPPCPQIRVLIYIYVLFCVKTHVDLFETQKLTPVHKNMYVELPYHAVFYRQTQAHALKCRITID